MTVFVELFRLISDFQLPTSKNMNSVKETLAKYINDVIDKYTYIKCRYREHYAALFNYAEYLAQTHVKKLKLRISR